MTAPAKRPTSTNPPKGERLERNVERLRAYLDRESDGGEVAVPIAVVRMILGRV